MKEIESILIDFQAHGISQVNIEHALDLSFGSIERAKLTDDPEMITLLRIVRTYPWLLQVAENNYDEIESSRILLHNAVDILVSAEKRKMNEKILETNQEANK